MGTNGIAGVRENHWDITDGVLRGGAHYYCHRVRCV